MVSIAIKLEEQSDGTVGIEVESPESKATSAEVEIADRLDSHLKLFLEQVSGQSVEDIESPEMPFPKVPRKARN
jgi:hypothetical protein